MCKVYLTFSIQSFRHILRQMGRICWRKSIFIIDPKIIATLTRWDTQLKRHPVCNRSNWSKSIKHQNVPIQIGNAFTLVRTRTRLLEIATISSIFPLQHELHIDTVFPLAQAVHYDLVTLASNNILVSFLIEKVINSSLCSNSIK